MASGLSDEDRKGLEDAYSSESGVVRKGQTVYIAGTRNWEEAASWPLLPFTSTHTARYRTALQYIQGATRAVGHSLGAAVANDLVPSNSLGIGGPGPTTTSLNNWGDPVSIVHFFRTGKPPNRFAVGHALSAYR